MSGLNSADLEIIKDILGPEDDDDPIFGHHDDKNNDRLKFDNPPSRDNFVSQKPTNEAKPFVRLPNGPQQTSKYNGPLVKCTSICLGGSDLPVGITTETSGPHFCSALSCISCDFSVARFPDCRWKKTTDYLFLRNNFPENVQQNLVRAPGWCAYCCQCTFCEEQTLRKLPAYSSNWVCRGHRPEC